VAEDDMKRIRHIIVIDSLGISYAAEAIKEIMKSFDVGKLKKGGSGEGYEYAVTVTVRRVN
jgi:hypothetical protein